MQQD
jgi:hypothetical protein